MSALPLKADMFGGEIDVRLVPEADIPKKNGLSSLANPLGPTWLLWGQGLFITSAVIWVLFLIPTQVAQARMARAFAEGGQIPESYWRLGRRWAIWGMIATLLPSPRSSPLRGRCRSER